MPLCYILSQELSYDPRAQIKQDSKFAISEVQDFLFFKALNKIIYKPSSQRDINYIYAYYNIKPFSISKLKSDAGCY